MRGSPPFQLALLLLGFFLLGVPLVQLTSGHPSAPASGVPSSNVATATRPVLLRVRYAHLPQALSVKYLGQELLPQTPLAASVVEARADLAIPAEGLEFVVTAQWPTGTPDTALTLEVEPEALETQSQTRWSLHGHVEDAVSFAWKS